MAEAIERTHKAASTAAEGMAPPAQDAMAAAHEHATSTAQEDPTSTAHQQSPAPAQDAASTSNQRATFRAQHATSIAQQNVTFTAQPEALPAAEQDATIPAHQHETVTARQDAIAAQQDPAVTADERARPTAGNLTLRAQQHPPAPAQAPSLQRRVTPRRPVTRRAPGAGALQLIEDGVHLFRAATLSTLCWHWAGSVPFAIAAALFWNDVTHPRTPESRFVFDALVLATLLAWMNLCRAVYAGRLRSQLAGEPVITPRPRELRRALIAQTFVGATKLWVLPFALVSVYLLAPAVSYYRNTLVLATRPGVLPLDALSRARRYATHRPTQSWKTIGLLLCIFPLLLFNLALALNFLPQLLRMLTGYESVLSRIGSNLISSGTFWVLCFALAWLLFDPFVQAVYCVRCFQAESDETGEDLKANLRILRGATKAVACFAVLAFSSAHLSAATPPSPSDLKRAVEQAAKSPEYDWRTPPQLRKTEPKNWFVAMVDRTTNAISAAGKSVGDAIDRFFRWIFGRQRSYSEGGGAQPTTSVPLGVYALIAVVLAVGGYFLMRIMRPNTTPISVAIGPAMATQQDAEDMDPARFPEQSWIDLADRALADQDYRLAMRAYYLASLAWLGRREFIRIHTGKTNREYQVELGRHTRNVPTARDLFAGNVAAIERTWYGMHPAGVEDVEGFRQHMTEMQSALEAAR